jgi:hypothetical protein
MRAELLAISIAMSDDEYERTINGDYDAELGIAPAPAAASVEMVACPVLMKSKARGKPGLTPRLRPKVLDLESGTAIYFKTRGTEHEGVWDNEGQLIRYDDHPYTSISGWAQMLYGKPINGWSVCYIREEDGTKVPLSMLRKTVPKTRD